MSETAKEAPLLRWHNEAKLVSDALWTEAFETARSLLRNLYFVDRTHTADPYRYRDSAAEDARRLIDLASLRGIDDVNTLLVRAVKTDQYYAGGPDLLAEAHELLADVASAPTMREG